MVPGSSGTCQGLREGAGFPIIGAMPPTVSLRFQDLRRSFGRLRVLDGVSGSVETGQVLQITGANGSGKSTLLRCLAGLMAEDSGEVCYQEDGAELDRAGRRRRLGYASPDLTFYGELTVEENLRFFARLRRLEDPPVPALLERVGLPPDRFAGALSSGMNQRLRWCFALLHRPRLLLLDEPFQNLDTPGRTVARELLEEHLEEGAAIVANPGALDLPHVAHSLQLAG